MTDDRLEPQAEGLTEPEESSTDLFPADLGRKVVPVLLVAVLLYGVMVALADADATFREIRRIGLGPTLLAALISLLSFVIRALRWHLLVRGVHSGVPLSDNVMVSFAGLAMTITPGKAGEVLKSLMLKAAHSVPVARSAPLLLLERICDLLTVMLLTALGLAFDPRYTLVASLGVVCVAVAALACALLPRFIDRVPPAWLELGPLKTRKTKARAALLAFRESLALKPFMVALLLSIVAWSVQSTVVWLLADAYGVSTVGIADGIVAYCAPLLAGALALVPGGLGAAEATMTGILMFLADDQLTLSAAAALTILVRLVTFWWAIGIGLGALALWRVWNSSVAR
jgi:uncharacterized protein (TIRG00374 family)